jgi:hypothetical protein
MHFAVPMSQHHLTETGQSFLFAPGQAFAAISAIPYGTLIHFLQQPIDACGFYSIAGYGSEIAVACCRKRTSAQQRKLSAKLFRIVKAN